MPKKESPLQQLNVYLPEGSFEDVVTYLHEYKVHLTVTRERKSVLGDYRNSHSNRNHRISVNGNLNKYSFLITLLHELGHLLGFAHTCQGPGQPPGVDNNGNPVPPCGLVFPGNPIADILLRDSVFSTTELKSLKRTRQRWQDLEFYVADSARLGSRVNLDLGFRFSHFEPPYMADDQQGNFVLSAVNPALGNSPCNGLLYVPGNNKGAS